MRSGCLLVYSLSHQNCKGSFSNYITLNLWILSTYLPYVTLGHKLKYTYHRCHVTLLIFLTIVFLSRESQANVFLIYYIFYHQSLPDSKSLIHTINRFVKENHCNREKEKNALDMFKTPVNPIPGGGAILHHPPHFLFYTSNFFFGSHNNF